MIQPLALALDGESASPASALSALLRLQAAEYAPARRVRRSLVRNRRRYADVVDEQGVLNQIEDLVAEEHALWRAESDGRLHDAGHERLAEVRRALSHAYATLRRRRAGQPGDGPADRDVPDPPNELDGPEREPPHAERGVHADDSSGGDPAPNAP